MSYARDQRVDHQKYDQLRESQSYPADNSIPMDKRDPWDTRVSFEELQNPHPHPGGAPPGHVYGHVRQESAASASDVLNEPYQPPHATNYNYRY